MYDVINEKIVILNQLGILRANARKQADALRTILGTCKNEIQIDQKLHDVIVGNKTLKDLIEREAQICINQSSL